MGIDHQQVQLLLAVFMVHGGDQHTAGLDTHHRARRKIRDGDAGLADQLFRLIISVDTAENGALLARAVVKRELQKLLRLLHGFAGENFDRAEIGLGEGLKIDKVLEQRLYLNVGEVYLLRLRHGWLRGLCGLLIGIKALHCGDKIPHME